MQSMKKSVVVQYIYWLWALCLPVCMVNEQLGNYTLSVKLFEYHNPDSMVPILGGICCNILCGSECNNYFVFCLRPAGTDGNECPLGRFQSDVSSQGDNINFQIDTEELDIPNPLRFTNITNLEAAELYITAFDDTDLVIDILVDRFLVEVDLENGLSEQMTLSGENEIAEIQLRIDVGCSENFYGLNCDIFCNGGSRICGGSALSSSTQALVGVIIVILLLAAIAVTVAIVVYILWRKGKVKFPKKHAGANSKGIELEASSITPGDNPTYGGAISEPTSAPTSDSGNPKYEYISSDDRTHMEGAREGNENTYTYIANISVLQHTSTPVPSAETNEIPCHYETSENFMRTTTARGEITTPNTELPQPTLQEAFPAHYETIKAEPRASGACANKDITTIECHYEFETHQIVVL